MLPARQEEERTQKEALTLCCQHVDIGRPFKVVGGSQNSLNAHLRHCKFKSATKATEPVAKGKKTKSVVRAATANKADKREKKEKKEKKGETGAEKKKKPSQKAAPKVDSHILLLASSSNSDAKAHRQPAARAARGRQTKGRKLEQQDDQPNQAMVQ